MFAKTALALATLLVASAAAGIRLSTQPQEMVSLISLEEPCVRQGGLCLRMEDCSPGMEAAKGKILCPLQHHLNVTCCYT